MEGIPYGRNRTPGVWGVNYGFASNVSKRPGVYSSCMNGAPTANLAAPQLSCQILRLNRTITHASCPDCRSRAVAGLVGAPAVYAAFFLYED